MGTSPPCGWCGLKYTCTRGRVSENSHHLAGGVDWNFFRVVRTAADKIVTTLRVVWIEMLSEVNTYLIISVTTLRVVWIEIALSYKAILMRTVTTLRVVWIEMYNLLYRHITRLSPPCGWCGLKSSNEIDQSHADGSPPCGWCGLK